MNDHSPGAHGPFSCHVDPSYIPPSLKLSRDQQALSLPDHKDVDAILSTDDHKKMKNFIRTNHWPADHETRCSLWLKLCMRNQHSGSSIYQEEVKSVFGEAESGDVALPSFVDPSNMFHYHLNEQGVHIVKKIMCVLGHTNPDITHGPAIFALTCLLLHYMDEKDAYDSMYMLLRSREGYVAQTKIAYEASRYVLKELAKKYARQFYTNVTRSGMVVEGLFENWLWWILQDLPFPYLVRVMDCYIFEGPKVFYRVALTILILFYKTHMKYGNWKAGQDISLSISQFCEDMPVSVDTLLKKAFSIRGLSRKFIRKTSVKCEMYVRSMRHATSIPHMPKSDSCNSLNLRVSRSHTDLTAANSSILDSDQGKKARARSQSHGTVPFTTAKSELIGFRNWQTIWRWLPTRIALYRPELIYTTSDHGTSLRSLYSHLDGKEPVLLLIKTSKNEVIGAYCSTDWLTRKMNQKTMSYFGTGETFIFTISPVSIKYEWVGIKKSNNVPHSAHLFQAGDATKLTIGGGSGEGLTLDGDLNQGRSCRCDTFDNEPLTESEYFTCVAVEAFSFE